MFRLVTCLLGASLACLPKNIDVEKLSLDEIKELVQGHWPEATDDDLKAKVPQLTQKVTYLTERIVTKKVTEPQVADVFWL